jgi:membrane protein YdbS with pleckstrin-like domain
MAFVILGAWYLTRGVQRRMRATAQSRAVLDPTLTRLLRYSILSFVLFGVFFFLWILSSVNAWATWIEWSNGIAMVVALVATFALASIAGWRSQAEEEKVSKHSELGEKNRRSLWWPF